jgi:hypothetical protein
MRNVPPIGNFVSGDYRVKIATALLLIASAASPAVTCGQSATESTTLIAGSVAPPSSDAIPGNGRGVAPAIASSPFDDRPFSHLAFGGGSSTLGINLAVATNLNRYMNLRGTGNVFQFSLNNLNVSDFNVGVNLSMASAGAALDLYPFPNHGLRFSPGVLFMNQNQGSGTFLAKGGSNFTLNNITYYSSASDPVQGSGTLGLHSQSPAFTLTTGWGNIIPRRENKHLSFPFEIGVAFIGDPAVNVALTSGEVCSSQGNYCTNVATDQPLQNNLQAQVAKYRNDLDPLKTFPIITGGVAYSFRLR